ncbi:hypothetical protein AB0L88_33640 [Saccharopolyspora shandongensis]|uniref:Uncharacterized protein n=1 Tax=Saccharopolyspora shandongensis TaxID=418495 RepID=A0A1H2UX32_9PSEU|nr:hypothetical protein [Saccharopolyspora shandongensis]SDW60652.1 hypothetical protein SAMN05216215_1004121 [Saccharopolyspora shandongensis]
MSSIVFGVAYAALIALLGVLFGYPLDPVLIALAVPAAVAFLARGIAVSVETAIPTSRRRTWLPMWCLGGVTALVVLGEALSNGERLVVGGVLVGFGPQWIEALVLGWPRLLLLIGVAALCGLRHGQERSSRRRAFGLAAVLSVLATGCITFGTTLPAGLLAWALPGQLLAFLLAGVLLFRSGLLLPVLLLAVGALLGGFDEQLLDVGVPAAVHLVLWPAYLGVALLVGALEALGRRLLRVVGRARRPPELA